MNADQIAQRESPSYFDRRLLALWAKLPCDSPAGGYHPLLCHLLDTGEVARLLFRSGFTHHKAFPAIRSLDLPNNDVETWLCFYAALHDLGKAYPAWQSQDVFLRDRLKGWSLHVPPGVERPLHGMVSAWGIRSLLETDFGHSRMAANQIGEMSGGHHGIFPAASEIVQLHPSRVGGREWQEVRRQIARWLAQLLQVPSKPPSKVPNAVAMVFSGLISVADWIASNELYFPYAASRRNETPSFDLSEYHDTCRRRAANALEALGWQAPNAPESPRSFTQLFAGYTPRPLQQAAEGIAQGLDHPSLVLIEAPMGEGKTEAALMIADHFSSKASLRGLYFALPTQATSNQIFGRVCEFLRRTSRDPQVQIQLLHGHASLSAEFQILKDNSAAPFIASGIDGSGQSSLVASEWFTFRKRGLLAPYGVGTVDQILLAVLQARHVFVRNFGLSGKVVVIDEVHAYDTYMSALLERLLAWFAATGTSVVLLSATLPAARRALLIRSFATGLGAAVPEHLPTAPYPRISTVSGSAGAGVQSFTPSDELRKRISLRTFVRIEDWIPILSESLAKALDQGGCAVVICNTVARAQEVYLALESVFPGPASDGMPMLDLLHSRFPFDARHEREKRCLSRFGPPSQSMRPMRAVLVATQIVEQSLDLDFDLMVTDLAPIDLIFQRAGRLHRHDRSRPPLLTDPQMWLIAPTVSDDGAPAFERADHYVYDSHVLLRTWLSLQGRDTLDIPADIEPLIESVYDEQDCPLDLPAAVAELWSETRSELVKERGRDLNEASNRWLKPPLADCTLESLTKSELEEDSPEFHQAHQALTRLADTSVSVVFLYSASPHPSLCSDGSQPIDLGEPPTLSQTAKILHRSVTLNDRRVVYQLLAQQPPADWRRNQILRHCRHLCLDAYGAAVVGGYRIRLDENLGVLITKEQHS